jgi:hypothetical protein
MRLHWTPAVALLLLFGCASTEPIVLNLPYGNSVPERTDKTGDMPSCRIVIAAVKDERLNRETLGIAGGQPIVADHVSDWIALALGSLSKSGYSVTSLSDDYARAPNDVVAEVRIQRVYARTIVMTFEAVVTLTTKLSGPHNVVTERQYRGSSTKINWANGHWEITSILNEALADAMLRMSEDIGAICRIVGS